MLKSESKKLWQPSVQYLPIEDTGRDFDAAFDILFANIGNPKYLNIITELNKIDVGFAEFLPAKLIPECGIPCENNA